MNDAGVARRFRRCILAAVSDTVLCPSCGRKNGLRRTACIYCGVVLPVTDFSAGVQVPNLAHVEDWERGYTVVLAPLDTDGPTERQVTRLAEIARLDDATARAVIETRLSLPIVRVATEDEARLVARLLGEAEFGTTILDDNVLRLRELSRRVREVRIGDDSIDLLVLWGDWVRVERDAIQIIVEGRIVDSTVEILEGSGRKRGTLDVQDTSQYFQESYAIDVYAGSIDESFRLKPDIIDYTCLGIVPSPMLEANIAELSRQLRQWVGPSRYDGAYRQVAKLLEPAWPPTSRVSSGGQRRRGDFKKYTRSSVTTEALAQFTRYSRMRFSLTTGV